MHLDFKRLSIQLERQKTLKVNYITYMAWAAYLSAIQEPHANKANTNPHTRFVAQIFSL